MVDPMTHALAVPPQGVALQPLWRVWPKTFAEFFAGIGLMRLGLESRGWTARFANDIDPQKYEMYQHQFGAEDRQFLLRDINHISADDVPTVTLATASFPCTDLSLAGAREGLKGKQSSTFWAFIRILRDLGNRKPPLVLLENVTGFLTSRRGADFEAALIALNELGYEVDAFVLDAAHFVPQSRQRLFVVGRLSDSYLSQKLQEQPSFYQSGLRPKALADFILLHPQIKWKFHPLPSTPRLEKSLASLLDTPTEAEDEWWDVSRAAYLLNQMSDRHRAVAKRMMEGETWSYGTVFRRMRKGKSMAELRTDGLAGCLRTPKGGSGRQILFKAGKGRYYARLISPREAARLMGADDYRISVPLNQALFGFGDAVCVPAVAWIAEHLLNPLVEFPTRTPIFQL